MSATAFAASLLRDVADAAFDPRCAAGDHDLGRARGPACEPCLERLAAEGSRPRCESCSATSPERLCAPCAERPRRVRVLAPRDHGGMARALILALKAHRREDAARPLAHATHEDQAVRDALRSCDVVVPVPSHPIRRRERGFHPAEAIAHELAALASEHGAKLAVRSVIRARGGAGKQSIRSARERRKAMRGTLRVSLLGRFAVRGRAVVVVDDVVTTGATSAEAARVLLRAGASRVVVVACTRAPGVILDVPRVVLPRWSRS